MKKVFYRAGETLVETMFSLAIISVTFVFLTGAVVAATRVNSKIRNSGSEFKVQKNAEPVNSEEVKIQVKDENDIEIDDPTINIYQSEKNEEGNRYYYYRVVD